MRIHLTRLQRAATAAASLALASVACGTPPVARENHAAAPPVDVRVTPARSQQITERVEVGGIVRATDAATIASRIMAPIVAVHVTPGDRVRHGQLLVQLDDQQATADARRADAQVVAAARATDAARAGREAAEAGLALAVASHERVAALHAKRSATPHELDQAVAALKNAQGHAVSAAARVEEAAAALASAQAAAAAAGTGASYARLTAPFDGIVTEKLAEPGSLASPGLPLLRLDRSGPQRVEMRLDAARATGLAQGQPVQVTIPRPTDTADTVVDGTVAEIARAVDVDARTVLVKIALPALDGVTAGTFVRVAVPGPSRTTVVVPASAIQRHGQVANVFVVEADVARRRLVRTGPQTENGVAIDAGLDANERVVTTPPPLLADGGRVRVTTEGGQ